MTHDGTGATSADVALVESMGAKLQYSWDRYITFIHEILLITGGTILVLINGMFGKDARPGTSWTWLGLSAIGAAVFGMVAGMGWRLTSQYFMDREVFGSRDDVERYFEVCGIRSVSDYGRKYYDETQFSLWRGLFLASQRASIACLFLAWGLGAAFVYLRG